MMKNLFKHKPQLPRVLTRGKADEVDTRGFWRDFLLFSKNHDKTMRDY